MTEIERLRMELDKAHRLLSQSVGWQRDAEIVKAKQAQEIERLHEALDVCRKLRDTDLDDDAVAFAMLQVAHYGVTDNDLRCAIAAYLNAALVERRQELNRHVK